MSKIAGVVILYNPKDSIYTNILTYLHKLSVLYIIDNSTVKTNIPEQLLQNKKVKYFYSGENCGIAVSLNKSIELAVKNQADFLLTMDQDSFFDNKNIDAYFSKLQNLKNKNIVMFGVNYTKNSKKQRDYEENKLLITSGSVINLKLAHKIGKFDENLFIDEVDTEYCLRIMSKKYHTALFPNIFLHHQLGKAQKVFTWKTNSPIRTIHSAQRIYYIVRNYLYVRKKYKDSFPTLYRKKRKELLNSLKNNIFYNPERIRVLSYIIKGYKDYKKQKMGRIEH